MNVSEYLKLPDKDRPRVKLHDDGHSFAAALIEIEYITPGMWAHTCNGWSWCLHGGRQLDIIDPSTPLPTKPKR